ncbi:MAG: guanylate kinase, partial [Pirellulaceae bacterium]
MRETGKGRLVILSGPSGSGKTTIVRELLARGDLNLQLSVSATTRKPRAGEKPGAHYHFLTPEEFHRKIDDGEFLEYVEVFRTGHWYGTLQEEVDRRLNGGIGVLLEIDVEGAMKVVERYPDAITIFLSPDSAEELERRLRARGTETEEAIQRRLSVASEETAQAHRYEFQVINRVDQTDATVQEIANILLH